MRIERDVAIAMDDGIVLRADVYRPLDGDRYPVILSHGPYGKGLAFQDGYADQWNRMVTTHPDVAARSSNKYQIWEAVDPEKWVPDGYVCVRVDSRGAGRSPGHLDAYSPRETQDYAACIEWAGTQPWSNGKVGLSGISYYAINQWQVASLQPPHLAAICVWEGAADFYRDMTYHGGIRSTFFGDWFPKQVANVQHGVGERGPVGRVTGELVAGPETLSVEELRANRTDLGDAVREHPLDDSWHRERSPIWERIEVPLLSAANWGGQGLHARGNFEGFVRAASNRRWLEVHGLEHWTHYYTDYGVDLQKRFFDHVLKGVDNGWSEQPPVQLQVRKVDGSFEQRGESAWPLVDTRWWRLHLDLEHRMLVEKPVASDVAVPYDALGDGITFMTEPLEHETEITGPSAAKVFVSSSTTDADLFLVLRVFDPAGREVLFQGALDPRSPVSLGWMRASHRKLDTSLSRPYRPYHTHDEHQPLTPGDVYGLDVEIWPTCVVVPAGYRIGLTVRGKDYEHDAEPAPLAWVEPMTGVGPFRHIDPEDRPADIFGGTQTLHAGNRRDAYLLLPVIPPRRDGEAPSTTEG
ncbi:CocE/NonD family hydrolase [Kribbella sp. VKM Ac-2566]|uniref:CocE/NonD family hydrolase n=1 Tax=Kribbella sp. VKM Ac-2566 TaxID=2512218 RepID=UPI001062BB14